MGACFLRARVVAYFLHLLPDLLSSLSLSVTTLSYSLSLLALTFGAFSRSRSLVFVLIPYTLTRSISLGFSFLASSFVSLSLYSDNLSDKAPKFLYRLYTYTDLSDYLKKVLASFNG